MNIEKLVGSKILFLIIIIILLAGGFFAWRSILGDEKTEVKNLVRQFYKSIEEQNGDLAMSYFTLPTTPAEKERYDWFIAADFPEGQRFFRGFMRIKVANPIIKSIEKLDKDKFLVNLTDDFQSWSNTDPIGYGPVAKRDMVIIAVKRNNKWLIDEWDYPAHKYKVNKYSGFGQEEIISSDKTTNWRIYNNEEYGFEIKYPNILELKEWPQNTIADLGVLPWLIKVEFTTDGSNEKIFASVFARDFNRVNKAWCSDIGGKFSGAIMINGQNQPKCPHPEFGASEVSEYSISIGQKNNIFFDFDCDDLNRSQICDQILSTFRFLE